MDFRSRITIEPGKRGGRPCIRGLRITVYDVLEWLAGGMSEDEILHDFPDLEREDIRAAWDIADRHHLHKPIVEQPQYHLFHRRKVEEEFAPLYEDIGLGLTTWSPLASGLLTGKYRSGIPAGTRGAMETMAFLREQLTDQTKNEAVAQLAPIAAELSATRPLSVTRAEEIAALRAWARDRTVMAS